MNPKVLVIDDSMMVRQQVKRALAGGFEVVEAQDGVDALEKASHYADFSLVICDVNMPKLSGLDMLELLKGQGNDGMPVLMLTTEGRPDLIERARAFGAKGWMVKPFKPTMLLVTVKKLARPVAA